MEELLTEILPKYLPTGDIQVVMRFALHNHSDLAGDFANFVQAFQVKSVDLVNNAPKINDQEL